MVLELELRVFFCYFFVSVPWLLMSAAQSYVVQPLYPIMQHDCCWAQGPWLRSFRQITAQGTTGPVWRGDIGISGISEEINRNNSNLC
jgi:hypothetical protein